MDEKNLNINISLPSNKDSLHLIEELLLDFRKSHSMSDENFNNLIVSVTEGINNAIIHGNKYSNDKSIGFQLNLNGNRISIIIMDQGEGFDSEEVSDPRLPENLLKGNGRGVFIIKNLMNETEFINTGNGTKLFMTLNID
ncbi:MAG: ATP-binding protein [Candidatus Kapabacteria bacterium]|nr:ATP-binding protein [Candidatus Kapabacteria bacterium]